jgi:nicotinamide phosphoribosyltransferase
VYSYFESRNGSKFDETVFFGLQYYLKKYLQGKVVTQGGINHAESVVDAHIGPGAFNRAGWEYILNKHDGKLPIRIKAVPEGTVVPISNVLMTIENTDPECYWLTNYLETLLVQVWYPTTVATISREVKKVILQFLEDTGDPAGIDFKLHDFGFRGVSSVESAGTGGLAHLINFLGTDTIEAITTGMDYYDSGVCGHSIPASEHSTITSWGKDGELAAYLNMLIKYPNGPVACVSDSYDIMHACDIWGQLREHVEGRDGFLVVRPDSGEPTEIVPKVILRLMDNFGYTTNEKGYKVLNPKVRVIQGDGCNYESIRSILYTLKCQNISADNIAFGMGGGLLQQLNRDTQRFAFKCSAIKKPTKRGTLWEDVWKAPTTDPTKNSKRGRLALIHDGNAYKTVMEDSPMPSVLETVFEDGNLLVDHKFEDVKQRAHIKPMRLVPA